MRLHMLYGLRINNNASVNPEKITRVQNLFKMSIFLIMNITRTIRRNYKNNLIIRLKKCNVPGVQNKLFLSDCSR